MLDFYVMILKLPFYKNVVVNVVKPFSRSYLL